MSALPSGWAEAHLGDIVDLIRGVTYKKEQASAAPGPGLVPLLRATNVKAELILDDDLVFVPNSVVRPEQVLQVGDIVVASSSGSSSVVGKSAIVRHGWQGAFGAFCTVLRPKPEIDASYAGHYVASPAVRGLWSSLAAGTSINNLKRKHFEETVIPVAPFAEQRRIVAAIEEQFSRLDAAEDLLRRSHRRVGVLRDRVIETAFSGSWEWTTLDEIAEIVGGVTKDTKRQADPAFVEVPYLRVANVQRGFLDLTEVATIRVPPGKAAALELRPGDVLFNEGGDRDKLGRGWVWSGEIEHCIHQNHVFRVRLCDQFEPKFVSWHGNTFGRRWFDEHGRQTTNLASLNLNTLKSFPVPAPPIDEQRRIVAEVERQLSLTAAMAAEIDRALRRSAVLRRSVREQAFTGILVPQDPAEEPATVLLALIAEASASEPKAPRGRRKVPA